MNLFSSHSGIIRARIQALARIKSARATITDESECTSCRICEDRCHFGARKVVNGKLEYNKDLCFGCGLCVSTCPTKAITLIPLL